MATSTWYQDFFSRNFAWLLAVFGVISMAQSAMQVFLATAKGGIAFEKASYGFAITSLFLVAGTAFAVLLIWAVLFISSSKCSDEQSTRVKGEERCCVFWTSPNVLRYLKVWSV